MRKANRGKQARRLAAVLAERFGLREVDVIFDHNRDGPVWRLSWSNGPTYNSFQAALDELAAEHAPDVQRWDLSRFVQDDGWAVQAVRLALADQLDRYGSGSWQIEAACNNTDDPDHPASPREAAMAEHLLQASQGSPQRMAEMIAERGLAWLLPGQADSDSGCAKVEGSEAALCHLTTRYAHGEARERWVRQIIPLPADQAVRAALADPQADETTINAALTLLPRVRAEAEERVAAIERETVEFARSRGQSWSQIGRLMGVTAQGAQQRAARRAR